MFCSLSSKSIWLKIHFNYFINVSKFVWQRVSASWSVRKRLHLFIICVTKCTNRNKYTKNETQYSSKINKKKCHQEIQIRYFPRRTMKILIICSKLCWLETVAREKHALFSDLKRANMKSDMVIQLVWIFPWKPSTSMEKKSK